MYNLFRLAHIMGLMLYMGSLVTFNVANGIAPDIQSGDYLYVCKLISAAAINMTIIGMVMTVGSGALLMGFGKIIYAKSAWLVAKILISVGLILMTLFIFIPSSQRALHIAQNGAFGFTRRMYMELEETRSTEELFGRINIFACILLSYLGIARMQSFKFVKVAYQKINKLLKARAEKRAAKKSAKTVA